MIADFVVKNGELVLPTCATDGGVNLDDGVIAAVVKNSTPLGCR